MPSTNGAGGGGGHHHRSGGLRQSNKKNKRSNASKRSVTRSQGGKVNANAAAISAGSSGAGAATRKGGSAAASLMAAQCKADRRNHQLQARDKKRTELLRKKRGLMPITGNNHDAPSSLTSPPPPPRIVGIISLGSTSAAAAASMEERVRSFICASADRVVVQSTDAAVVVATTTTTANSTSVTCKFDVHKRAGTLTVLTASTAFVAKPNEKSSATLGDLDDNIDDEDDDDAAVMAALDLARVCDTLLFVVDGSSSSTLLSHGMEGHHRITEIRCLDQQSSSSVKTSKGGGQQPDNKWDHLISARGDRILAAVKGQGLPTPVTLLAQHATHDDDNDHMTVQSVKSLRRYNIKRQLDLKKYVSRFAVTEFGTEHGKVVEIDLSRNNNNCKEDDDDMEEDAVADASASNSERHYKAASATLVRTLCTMACAPAKWVANAPRSYVLTDCKAYDYDASTKELRLTGHVRGVASLDVNALFHVPGVGTFAGKSLQRAVPPLAKSHQSKTTGVAKHHEEEETEIIVVANPAQRESLNMYAAPDALEGEQNLIGFDDEGDEEKREDEGDDDAFARPAGWSDYQSAWLDAVDQDIDGANNNDDDDNGELAKALNNKKASSASIATEGGMDLDDANNEVSETERLSLMAQRKKQHSDENDFPDEVQVQEDEKARERFARYRSLKSFRKSHWDAKENLPDSFASIYHFSSFKQTQRTVMNDRKDLVREAEACKGNFFGKSPPKPAGDEAMADVSDEEDDDFLEGCVPSGSYITLTLEEVPAEAMANIAPNALLTAVAILSHENKVSVLHMGLSQTPGCDSTDEKFPIKSKDVLTFRCGWRTWKARPVFSQNNLNCDKHKFERFLPTGGAFFAASVFGPVTYTPCPILVFRERGDNAVGGVKRELVAIGSMMGADADRIVVKRIVLTGYPVRVHKRHATVKYMFYEPEDVKWFTPAGLHTKHGLQGNIVQSVGEHGTMKCLFNAPIKQHDTVCLPLYKRIYPKYAALAGSEEKSRSGATTYRESSTNLVVL